MPCPSWPWPMTRVGRCWRAGGTMSQKDDAGTEREQVPPSAVDRQLDDHHGRGETPYDAESGLERLRGWMGDEEPPDEARPQVEPVPEAEQRLRLAGARSRTRQGRKRP